MKNKEKKRIAFIPPSGIFVQQDGFFKRISKYFANKKEIETYLIIIDSTENHQFNTNMFEYFIKVNTFEDLLLYLKKEKFDIVFHRSWMHRYKFAGDLSREVDNLIVYIKDWMEEIPREKYKFLYTTDNDYDGIKDIFNNSKLILSHYDTRYTNKLAKKYNISAKKFIFFPEYCNEENFRVRENIIYNQNFTRLLWAGGIAPSTAPSSISSDKRFFQDFTKIAKNTIFFDMFVLEKNYNQIFDENNKSLWQDWLYEHNFNKNFNIKQGSTKPLDLFLDYDFALASGLTYKKDDLSLYNFCEAVVSKVAFYLELGIPLVVNKKWKAIADMVKKNNIGIVISNKDFKNLDTILKISKKEYNLLVQNIYNYRVNYTYNDQTMKPILKILERVN